MNFPLSICVIAALDRNRAIGRDGAMPWHLPDDLKRFKQLTLGKPVLMGRKTALAIGRALPGRRNLVLTRSGAAPFPDQQVVASLDAALAVANGSGLMVIGGGEIYALTLPYATRLHLTHVDCTAENPDAFFPPYDVRDWHEITRTHHAADAKHEFAFEFVDYARASAASS